MGQLLYLAKIQLFLVVLYMATPTGKGMILSNFFILQNL